MQAIEVENLKKYYGKIRAVDGISLSIGQGEVFALLGPNGAGKTTTIEIIEGLRLPDSGIVNVLGLDVIRQPRQVKSRIGIQLQNTALFQRLTVAEVLELFRTFYPGQTRNSRELIDLVDLGEKKDTQSRELSGGQRQRLSVALALVNYPEIVFLDEPTTGLDPQARRSLWDTIRQIQKSGASVLLTTHYMEEAQELCDRVAIIDSGTVIAMDTPGNLIQQNFNETIIEFNTAGSRPLDGIFHGLAGLTRPEMVKDHHVTLYTANTVATLGSLMNLSERGEIHFDTLNVRVATLEDVFLKLTGKTIRD
ncbi:MAG: ABC transporter ATP-binding protein [Chloroflexi bacterium]|nr:ABC transporter ATP-binding protein [Chloroflexota bacterium]